MSLQQQIVSLFCQTFKNANVKKVDKDNHLDIHIPALHEKRGTHIFFNTSKEKIKIGFYCRDKEYVVSLLSRYSEQIEVFSQGVRPIKNPIFLTAEEAVDAAIEFVYLLLGRKQDNNIDKNEKDEEIQEDNSKGYPMIAWKSDSDIPKDFFQVYVKRCQVESELYAYRMGVCGYLPEWMEQLIDNKYFYPFIPSQIDEISKNITENKVIPILDFVPDELYQHTKRVWWMVPFSIWRDSTASFLFVDKNGIYAMYEDSDGDIITNMIFPWDRIAELEFETLFDGDPNIVRMTLESDSGGGLSFDEFVSPHRGSYLKVIASIYNVRKKTIEESKGASTWYEGAGGEGFKRFEAPLHLIDEFKWISPDRPPAAMYGYSKEPEFKPPKEWPTNFLIALSMVSDKYIQYSVSKNSHDDFHQLLKYKIFDGDWDKLSEEWPKGLEIFNEIFLAGTESWDDVYSNIAKYFEEHIGFTSKESEFKIAGVIYEMWVFTSSNTLHTNFEFDELKPLYNLEFDGSKGKPPFGYFKIKGKDKFSFINKLYKIFGEENFWKAFLANLETEVQFFQIAYHLISTNPYNYIKEEGTIRYIASHNGNTSPYINSFLPVCHPFGLYVTDLIETDPYLCASLGSEHMMVHWLEEKLSNADCQVLFSSVKKVTCKLKLKLDAEDVKIHSGIEALLHDLSSENEIYFDLWVFKNRDHNYQDYLIELKKNSAYITVLINVFADKLINDAEELIVSTRFDSNEIPASSYLKSYAKWEISIDDLTYRLKSFTGVIDFATEEVESEEVTSSDANSITDTSSTISYTESLNHKAEALDLNTKKEVIEEHLMSPYRWVREAAAKHPTIDKEWIEKSIKDHEELVTDPSTDTLYDFWNVVEKRKFGLLDRYILKGLINNPNCTSVIRDKITVLLEDEEKYPTESNQYEILSTQSRPQYFITGELSDSVSVHSVAEAIINGGDWTGYIESTASDWRELTRENEYGPTTLVDCVIYPADEMGLYEGSEGVIDLGNFYPEEFGPVEGGDNFGSDIFFEFRHVIDKGSWIDYVFDLEYEFNPKYLKPIFNEYSMCGIVSSYEYNNNDTGDSVDDITGEFEESRPSVGGDISLFANTKEGLKEINFTSLKEEMVMKNINVTDLSEVTEFLDKKFPPIRISN